MEQNNTHSAVMSEATMLQKDPNASLLLYICHIILSFCIVAVVIIN